MPNDPSPRPAIRSQANQARGAYGERRAADWYVAQGYVVLDRNWRSGRLGELDLVLGHGLGQSQIVVFCEVKARATDAFGSGAEAVTPTKQRRLRQLAASWLAAHDHHGMRARFDVVSVTGTHVEVYEDAF